MPALMDSAVLLAADGPAAAHASAKALHPLEASGQLADTAAPTPTASGALEDWQVVTLAEIQTALSAAVAADSVPEPPCDADSEQQAPLPMSPSKARHTRSRRGRPKSGTARSLTAGDGAQADAEAPLAGGDAEKDKSRAVQLPGSGTTKPGGIRAWNPFAGFGPKLMGPRHKAAAHILDLAPHPLPDRTPAASDAEGGDASPALASALAATAPSARATAMPVPALADSTPDIDAAAAAANAGCSPAYTGAKSEQAPTPDYDTAKECGGSAGKGMTVSRMASSKLGSKDAAGGPADMPTSPGSSAGEIIATDDSAASNAAGGDTETGKVPAAASDYSLPKGKAKKGKKKRSRK